MDLELDILFKKVKNDQEIAILYACKEVIKDSGQIVSLASYFGVLFNIIQLSIEQEKRQFFPQIETTIKGDSNERCRAAVRLLEIVSTHLSPSTLKKVYGETAILFLAYFAKKPPSLLVRPALGIIRALLSIHRIFDDPNALKLYQILLEESIEGKPKIRKRSIDIMVQTLKESDGRINKISSLTEKFSISILRQCKQDNILLTLHVLQMLSHVIEIFPSQTIKNLAETALRLPSLGQSTVTVWVMKFMGSIFEAHDLSSVLCTSLINALLDLKPNSVDSDQFVAFMHTMVKGYKSLSKKDLPLTTKKTPQLLKEVIPAFQVDSRSTNKEISESIRNIFSFCITTDMIKDVIGGVKNQVNLKKFPYAQIVNYLKPLLKYAYQNSWNYTLEIIQCLFTVSLEKRDPTENIQIFQGTMATVLEDLIRDTAYLRDGRWIHPVENTLGAAINLIGIKRFLYIIPIRVPSFDFPSSEKQSESDNLWLLPFLKKYLIHSELSYFGTKFLPIVENLEENIKRAQESGVLVEAQLLSTIYLQIWDVFPSFCNLPSDIPSSFKKIAKILCTALIEKPKIRSAVSFGIQSLINKNKALLSGTTYQASSCGDPKENIAAIAVFSKNFLPGLFNLLVDNLPPTDHSYIYKTAQAFISISDSVLVTSMFSNVVTKLLTETSVKKDSDPKKSDFPDLGKSSGEGTTVSRLTDITAIFVPYLDMKNVEILFKAIRPQISSEDFHLQKKSYKVLVTICNHHRVLVESNFHELIKILEESEPKQNNTSTKKLRSRLMKIMFQEKKTLDIEALKKLLPEIILNTKEINVSTREAACDAIKYLGEKCTSLGDNSLQILCNIISAGLALEPKFVATTMSALGLLLSKFHSALDLNYKQELLQTLIIFLQSPHREVIHAALDFFRILIKIFPPEMIKGVIPEFGKNISSWNNGTKNKYHNSVKLILEKLIRKIGYETVYEHMPSLQNLLQNIKRNMTRQKNKKEKKDKNNKSKKEENGKPEKMEESEQSDEDIELIEPKPNAADGTWVVEGKTDDEIIDFLESSASKHVVSSDPAKNIRKRKKNENFEKSEDGRLIIEDLVEDDNKKKIKNSKNTEQPDVIPNPPPKLAQKIRKKKQITKNTAIHSAVRYKSKRAGGDVMKKDSKYEPYSYIPLDPGQLNKRRRYHSHKNYKQAMTKTSMKGRAIKKRRGKNK